MNVEHLLDLIDLDFFLVRKLVSSATDSTHTYSAALQCATREWSRIRKMEPTTLRNIGLHSAAGKLV